MHMTDTAVHVDDVATSADLQAEAVRRERRRVWAEHRSLHQRLTPAEIAVADRDRLIVMFRPFALSEAARFGDGSPDAVGDAMLGLVQAAESFDAAKGAFVPWAQRYIRQSIRRGAHRARSHIRIPAARRRDLARLYLASESTGSPNGSPKAMAEPAGLPAEEIEAILAAPRAVPVADTDICRNGQAGHDDPTTVELDTEEMIDRIEDEIGTQLPEGVVEQLRWWIRHDGSDSGLRPIKTAIRALAAA